MCLFHRPGPQLSVSCLATWPSPPQALLLAHHPFLSGWRIPVVVPWLLLTSGALTLIDSEYSASALTDGFMSPRPPIHNYNATRLRSASEQLRPMSDGMSTSENARSRGCSRFSISGSVLIKYVHRCLSPNVNAA